MSNNKKALTESQFYMWRTLFAIAHADKVVKTEELRFMAEALEDVPFSEGQRAVLNEDIKHPQDIEEMFAGITSLQDQAVFFKHAGSLVHVDGHYGEAEQKIMLKLQEQHLKAVDVDKLIGHVDLEFEDGNVSHFSKKEAPRNLKDTVFSFRERFIQDRFK